MALYFKHPCTLKRRKGEVASIEEYKQLSELANESSLDGGSNKSLCESQVLKHSTQKNQTMQQAVVERLNSMCHQECRSRGLNLGHPRDGRNPYDNTQLLGVTHVLCKLEYHLNNHTLLIFWKCKNLTNLDSF